MQKGVLPILELITNRSELDEFYVCTDDQSVPLGEIITKTYLEYLLVA